MARKYDLISELYEQTALEVTKSEEDWKAFLSTAGRNFRLRFDEQLLIYAQRPDAIAVLEIEKWNKNFGRWVNKGAKGIAVFADENRDTQRLNHYFDITDTHASRYAIPVPLWIMKDDYKQEVIETLENTFGELSQKTSFEDAIKESASHAVEDNINDYLNDLSSIFPQEDLTLAYKSFVTNSVGYMVMVRLGINADLFYSNDDFKHIHYFQSHDGLNAIGFATSDIAEMGLMPISKTINALDKQNRTIVSSQQKQYNKAKENERSQHDERTSLQHGGRLQPTQPNITEPTRSNSWQMGENEKNLSQGTSQDPLLQPTNERNLDRSSSRNPTTGNESRRNDSQDDVQGSRRERSIESQGYDEMGTDDQQHSSFSSGNREGTSDLQLSNLKPLPSYQEQMNLFESKAVDLTSTAFAIPQEVIDSTIAQGSGFVDGKMRIYEQFQKSLSQKENAEFLKKEYGVGGSSSAGGFDGYHQDHDSKGLKITKGYAEGAPKILLKWNQVTKRIDELIKLDRYLNAKEKERYPQWLEEITVKRLEEQERKLNQEILSTAPSEDIIGKEITIDDRLFVIESVSEFSQDVSMRDVTFQNSNGFPINRVEKLPYILKLLNEQNPQPEKEKIEVLDIKYEYHLGDKVYLGANEYEILSFDDNRVMLYDFDMPLFNKELTREEFDLKVKENPLNDHLVVKEVKKTDLATRIMKFMKDYDFYEYKDNLEANETDEDVIQKVDELLVDKESAKDIIDYFEAIDGEDLAYEEFIEYDSILNELHNLRDLLQEAKTLIDDYCNQEFDREDGADYSDLSSIGVAYTETDEGYPIQAIVDLNNFKIETEVMGVITHLEQYSSLEELVDKGLPNLDFSELTYISEDDEAKIEAIVNAPSKIETPSWEKKKSKGKSFDLYPDIPMIDRKNFNLKEHPVEVVGKKERFKRNIQAIRLLNTLEKEGRFATADEQEILSKFVGWGGISEAFDDRNSAWSNEFNELKSILDNEAYNLARESTLTAFYTPPEVIQAIYKVIEQSGFKEGNLLEPSCGVGNFIGMLPEGMQKSRIYGVEFDPTSAHIAQQLYQKSSIAPLGFEDVNIPDSFFDVVIGNVPFGDFKVFDKRYDKLNFLIHDYFFAKSLDKLRPGGVMALITSKGTMDKENSSVRKYIAQRAELIGAIRLPNNTFKGNAGTEVVSDILFLQKRDRLMDIEPDWVHLDTNENGIKLNKYFIEHPEMILGEMKQISGRYGPEVTCDPYPQSDLSELLDEAIANIHAEIKPYEITEDLLIDNRIPANPDIRNFSYTVMNDEIYYRENSLMSPVECSQTAKNRIKGMIQIRDTVRHLIELQTEDYPETDIQQTQKQLNEVYDSFTKKYGLINSRANSSAFGDDSSYALLSALEIINENGELERKADMFTKRTIKPHVPVTEVDSASEALALSIGEKACIDMEYMEKLTHKTEEELFSDLKDTIFLNPLYNSENLFVEKYLMADEYLSGNVREKLREAKLSQQIDPESFNINVEALEKVQPKDLTASEISVRLGATWLPPQIIKQFVFEFLDTPYWAQRSINIQFSNFTSEWRIENKRYDRSNVKAYSTYGTERINAYQIIEDTLNLKDVRIFDYVEDENGKKKPVLNKKETAIAQAKQELIKQGFQDWIWQDPKRREQLTTLYNEKFNSIRPREYDGSHIIFNGMNPEINLRKHQRNAVAHILYGGNTLLAHAVGAGKTFEMVAAAQESKRLGLCNKSLFVVPNHLTEQWAAEYLQLYPAANILVATKKDFETKNRKKFCGRIATGDYDAIIIGHSQFEKIPMSIERQRATLERQLEEISDGILDLRRNHGESFSIKQLEKSRKSIKQKLEKLNDQSKKDDVVTFEELGVDRLFIDESHYYKNLYLYTKMRNVGGIAQTEAQKSSDLFMKCRYLDEITGGRGVVFATGTPISNSMVELYTIQRYLQYDTLLKNNLQHFDSWASTFGETVTAVELTPEGTGYRAKTRFAKFYNLPELMSMFKEVADIQTSDMLKLPVPKVNFHNVAVKPSELQVEMVASLAKRAEKIRNNSVDSSVDNMLKITNDGRKLALDPRTINDMLPDFEGSKVNACVDNIFRIWQDTKEQKSTQLLFCDLSTPKKDSGFSVYDDVKAKLIEKGIPESEVKFIHEADSDLKKKELFKKVRKGDVRVLIGSTQKMGAGTNVQDKLIALHDLDCPWRPSDLEQRSGRIIRQGNTNPQVDIYRYVTEQTFDAYLYQLVEGKQKFASQIMTSKSPVRSAEDIDETALSYAEIKMLATGNPYIKEKMDLDIQVQKLKLLKSNYLSEKYNLEDKIIKYYPQKITTLTNRIKALEMDVATAKNNPKPLDDLFSGMKILDVMYTKKEDAGKAIIEACKKMTNPNPIPLGKYRGFDMELLFDTFDKSYVIKLKGETSRSIYLGDDTFGNITRLDNGIERFEESLKLTLSELDDTKAQFETAKTEVEKPFTKEEELKTKLARLDELNILLNMDKTENEIVEGDIDEKDVPSPKKERDYER